MLLINQHYHLLLMMMLHFLDFSNNLATLTLYSVPTEIIPAKSSDSMTLNLSGWLGLPAVPFVVSFLFIM